MCSPSTPAGGFWSWPVLCPGEPTAVCSWGWGRARLTMKEKRRPFRKEDAQSHDKGLWVWLMREGGLHIPVGEHKVLVSVGVGMVTLCHCTLSPSLSSASCTFQAHDGAGNTPGAVGPKVYGQCSSHHSAGRGYLLSGHGCGSRDRGKSPISLHPFPFSVHAEVKDDGSRISC